MLWKEGRFARQPVGLRMPCLGSHIGRINGFRPKDVVPPSPLFPPEGSVGRNKRRKGACGPGSRRSGGPISGDFPCFWAIFGDFGAVGRRFIVFLAQIRRFLANIARDLSIGWRRLGLRSFCNITFRGCNILGQKCPIMLIQSYRWFPASGRVIPPPHAPVRTE